MLPAFVIALREGIEAGLIVGIVGAFIQQNGRGGQLRWMWLGVGIAVAICLSGGVALHLLKRTLPQRQQEGLETIVGLVAVAFITYMIVWVRQNGRSLRLSIEQDASAALAGGSALGLIAMAFLAVLREGFETAVFLVATFERSADPRATGTGAVLGLVTAAVISWAIYSGGLRLNMARFFRITGLVLIVVAAGLVSSSLHTAHEAGWINAFQQEALDLEWLVRPGTVTSSLVTGMLGIQPRPTAIEAAGWLLYLVPVTAFVLWTPHHNSRSQHKPSMVLQATANGHNASHNKNG